MLRSSSMNVIIWKALSSNQRYDDAYPACPRNFGYAGNGTMDKTMQEYKSQYAKINLQKVSVQHQYLKEQEIEKDECCIGRKDMNCGNELVIFGVRKKQCEKNQQGGDIDLLLFHRQMMFHHVL